MGPQTRRASRVQAHHDADAGAAAQPLPSLVSPVSLCVDEEGGAETRNRGAHALLLTPERPAGVDTLASMSGNENGSGNANGDGEEEALHRADSDGGSGSEDEDEELHSRIQQGLEQVDEHSDNASPQPSGEGGSEYGGSSNASSPGNHYSSLEIEDPDEAPSPSLLSPVRLPMRPTVVTTTAAFDPSAATSAMNDSQPPPTDVTSAFSINFPDSLGFAGRARGPKVTYQCANARPADGSGGCGVLQEKGLGESLKCIQCGCPVLYKVRTKRMVWFEAR